MAKPPSEEQTRPQEAGRAGQREAVAALRGGLRAYVGILDLVYNGLLRDAERIAPSPSELDPEIDLDVMDDATEVRSVARSVAEDCLRPALDDLRDLLKEDGP